jgi:hypothetical protein
MRVYYEVLVKYKGWHLGNRKHRVDTMKGLYHAVYEDLGHWDFDIFIKIDTKTGQVIDKNDKRLAEIELRNGRFVGKDIGPDIL